jgi:aminoglycoside phosphotransferase (APT) family kinase protein
MTLMREADGSATAPMRARRPARGDDRLARARALAPEILALHIRSLPDGARRAVVSSAQVTSTGKAIVVLAPVGEPPCAVIKMPMTPGAVGGLERETAVLSALHADGRLGRWPELLPRTRAHGSIAGQPYRIDSALAGRPVLERVMDANARRSLLNAAAETIDVLHRATATARHGDPELAERWVDRPVRELMRHGGRGRALAIGLERLRDELHEALAGGTFSVGYIHGDYWLGNLLFSGAGSTTGAPDGIVDWDEAAPLELPLHDLLHLLLYTRRLITGRELGQIVRDHLRGGEWSADEHLLLDRHGRWRRDGSLSDRHALLLYWLRQVAVHARQQTPPVGYRYRLWERRNVVPVVTSL